MTKAVALAIGLSFASILALGACTETHDGTQVEFTPNSCLTCHTAGSGTNVLVHPESNFPLTSKMVHNNINCQDCHKFDIGPGLPGLLSYDEHADCTGACHLQKQSSDACVQYPQASGQPCVAIEPEHIGFPNPNNSSQTYSWDSVHHDFCLQCHPMGLL